MRYPCRPWILLADSGKTREMRKSNLIHRWPDQSISSKIPADIELDHFALYSFSRDKVFVSSGLSPGWFTLSDVSRISGISGISRSPAFIPMSPLGMGMPASHGDSGNSSGNLQERRESRYKVGEGSLDNLGNLARDTVHESRGAKQILLKRLFLPSPGQ